MKIGPISGLGRSMGLDAVWRGGGRSSIPFPLRYPERRSRSVLAGNSGFGGSIGTVFFWAEPVLGLPGVVENAQYGIMVAVEPPGKN